MSEIEESLTNTPEDTKEDAIVTPWDVSGNINYSKLIEQFGTEVIDQDLMDKFVRVTGKQLHPWMERGIFFTHRAMHNLLDAYENGEPVFLYTGRGPTSESLHVGHMVPIEFTKWLAVDVFDCPVVIQIADDEKVHFRNMKYEEVYRLGLENAKDIVAFGFNPEKTFIFFNRKYRTKVEDYELFVSDMEELSDARTVAKIFGFGKKVEAINNETGLLEEHYTFGDNITMGMFKWPLYQSAAAFSQAFPHIFGNKPAHCMVVYAIDQDPYFRLARDLAQKMKLIKPCSIMSTFMPPLTGSSGKMSSSIGQTATLFLTDTPEVLTQKFISHAFSGTKGDGTLKSHQEKGGDPTTDISSIYLSYFEHDDNILQELLARFERGELSCLEMKHEALKRIIPVITTHQERRAQVTDEIMEEFYRMKPIEFRKANTKALTGPETELYTVLDELNIQRHTLYHKVITTVEEGRELGLRIEGTLVKNLLLTHDSKYYLYVTQIDTNYTVASKNLCKTLGIKKIRFAENDKLQELLDVTPGCLTIFALMNDRERQITVVLDDTIPQLQPINFHPMRNDATTTIQYNDMLLFLNNYGYEPIYFSATQTSSNGN